MILRISTVIIVIPALMNAFVTKTGLKILRITNKKSFLKNMFGVKRPRSRTMGKGPVYGKPARKIIRRVPRVVPGVTRVGGYYGRFSGASAEQKFFDTSCSVADINQAAGAGSTPSIHGPSIRVSSFVQYALACSWVPLRSSQWAVR